MAATSLGSSPSKVTAAKLGGLSGSSSSYTQLAFCTRHAFQKIGTATALHKPQLELLLSPWNKHARTFQATDNDRAAPAEAQDTTITPPLAAPGSDVNPVVSGNNNSQQPQPSANGSPSEPPKRVPLTARERLRAARVLGRYAEPGGGQRSPDKGSSSKPEFGSRVLDALRGTDGGGGAGKKTGRKRSSGLPEAPSNMFDDSKRGLPKDGWTFDWLAALPIGTDVLVVAASFGLITIVMFGTTYLVWKLGAIHFNEY